MFIVEFCQLFFWLTEFYDNEYIPLIQLENQKLRMK